VQNQFQITLITKGVLCCNPTVQHPSISPPDHCPSINLTVLIPHIPLSFQCLHLAPHRELARHMKPTDTHISIVPQHTREDAPRFMRAAALKAAEAASCVTESASTDCIRPGRTVVRRNRIEVVHATKSCSGTRCDIAS